MKKIIILLVAFVLFVNFVNAETLIIKLNNSRWDLQKYYYVPKIENQFGYTGGNFFEKNALLKINYIGGKTTNITPFSTGIAFVDNPLSVKSFEIYNNGSLIVKKNVSFCNNNRICEPCFSGNCNVSENSFLCSDCSLGEKDNSCDTKAECDLDCREYYANYDIEKYKKCFEENFALACEDYGLISCGDGLSCDDEKVEISGKKCCTGSCVSSQDLEFVAESCSSFGMKSCAKDEFCKGKEVYYLPKGINCCLGTCEAKEDNLTVDVENYKQKALQKKTTAIIALILIIFLIFLIKYSKKYNKIIPLSFIVLIFIFSLFLITKSAKTNITGYVVVEPKEAQAELARNIAKAYNIDEALFLALLEQESNLNHYREDGRVKISGDCGVGISQQQYHGNCENLIASKATFICGTSQIDGRKLNAKILRDNLECGALELKKKYDSFSCDSPRQYHCSNSGLPIPEKKAIYQGWECALRGYNGWGCKSTYFEKYYGKGSEVYLSIVKAIQNYVESLKEKAKKYMSSSKNDDVSDTDKDSSKPSMAASAELRDKIGFYYLNPSFKIEEDFNLKKIHDELVEAPRLIKKVLGCQEDGKSLQSCVMSNKKDSWELYGCENNVCKFNIDTGQNALAYVEQGYEKKPFILKIALTFDKDGIKELQEWKDDIIPGQSDEKPESKISEPSDENQEPEEIIELPSGLVYGLDVSHWTGKITKEKMQCLWDMGVRYIITGTQNPEITKQQIMAAVDQGMVVDIYTYVYYDSFSYTGKGNSILNSLPPKYKKKVAVHWIDIEQTIGSYTRREVMEKIRNEIKTCQAQPGIECGIYTAPGPWSSITGNTKEFSNLPLWYAVWDGQKNFDSFDKNGNWWDGNFGGWKKAVGHQYKGTHYPCGVNADANVFRADFLAKREGVKVI